MTNLKLYYVSQHDFDAKIKNAKMPHQQMVIYKALANLGTPTRGQDVIAHAVKNFNLVTRQDYAVLAAWYFSPKRRHPAITLGVPAPTNEDPEEKIERLKAEQLRIAAEIEATELALLEAVDEAKEDEASEPTAEDTTPSQTDAA